MKNFKIFSFIILIQFVFPQFGNKINLPSIMGNNNFHIENGVLPKYNMNHSFSLMVDSHLGSTMGVYSNFFNYQFSEKFSFKSSVHVMNNQFYGPNENPFQLSYDLGFSYKISNSSRIQFNMIKLSKPSHQQFASPLGGL